MWPPTALGLGVLVVALLIRLLVAVAEILALPLASPRGSGLTLRLLLPL